MVRNARGVSGAIFAVLTIFVAAWSSGCAQSDAGITTKVKAKLEAERTLTSNSIHVDTANRVVTLSGTAASDSEKQKAVQLAKTTEGVKDVVDNLAVNPAAAAPQAPPAPAPGAPDPSGASSAPPPVSPAPSGQSGQ